VSKRTLLIDADIIAYRAAAAAQDTIDWGGGQVTIDARLDEAIQSADNDIDFFMEKLKADDCVICLSDDIDNFRKGVDPTYKQLRTTQARPVHLYDVKEYLRDTYKSETWPLLEADDVMGILSTQPHEGERIIVSMDKDMRTIPGLLCQPKVDLSKPGGLALKIEEIDELSAIKFHFWQTIVGDATDGYPGCPGVGPASQYAEDVLFAESEEEAWDEVLMAYATKGLTEAEALVQARLAFILRDGYLDGKWVKLWLPPYLADTEGAN
jgi:DNA polymerase-1